MRFSQKGHKNVENEGGKINPFHSTSSSKNFSKISPTKQRFSQQNSLKSIWDSSIISPWLSMKNFQVNPTNKTRAMLVF